MRTLRSSASRAWLIAGLGLALSLTAGGAGALASTSSAGQGPTPAAAGSRPAISALHWNPLPLTGGWSSAASRFETGSPAWAVKNGVVYLSGSLFLPSGSANEFALLPAAARPAHATFIAVGTFGGTAGNLEISPAGDISVFSSPFTNAEVFTSLAGVSYLAAGTSPGHELALKNGWDSSKGPFGTGNPSSIARGNVVHLSGGVLGGTKALFAVLPPADRPAHTMWLTVDTFAGSIGELEIFASGEMFAILGASQNYTSLDGVSFPAGSVARHKLTLVNHWKSSQPTFGTGDPAYSVTGGVVYLSGGLSHPGGTRMKVTTLPPAARPRQILYLQIYTAGASVGTVRILTDGEVDVYNDAAPSAVQALALLSGVSYPQHV